MRRRIYTDTSVIGGCCDEEFREHSVRLFDRFRAGGDILVISDLTLAEIEPAPQDVRAVLATVPAEMMEEIRFTGEAADLAAMYLAANVIGAAHLEDARHIATATIHRVTVLVSWNFKHIVNLERIQGYNSVNLRLGYSLLEIRSPQEVLRYED